MDMKEKLEPIARQIEIDFTPDAKGFYERVFAFSDRLTKVSDTIKVYPKGNARKEGTIHFRRRLILTMRRVFCSLPARTTVNR